jgi:ATP-dependent DNA helicase RecG
MEVEKKKKILDALEKVGIKNLHEVLLWSPRKFDDYSNVIDPRKIEEYEGCRVVLSVRMAGRPTPHPRESGRFTVALDDESGRTHNPMFFGRIVFSPWKEFQITDKLFIAATPKRYGKDIFLNGVEIVPKGYEGKVYPVYSGKPGVLASAVVGEAIRLAMQDEDEIKDAVNRVREAFGGIDQYDLMAREKAGGSVDMLIRGLHSPASMDIATWSVKALRKLAVAHLRYVAQKATSRVFSVDSVIRISKEDVDSAYQSLPFPPTTGPKSQDDAIRKIAHYLSEPETMDAILTADVGVGKTLTYMVPSIIAQRKGARVAVLVPNTILADQIVSEFRQSFPDVPVVLATEGVKKKDIDWSSNPVLIGTVKLFGLAKAASWTPNFLVIDEQQKMGKEQRERLISSTTNVLECTATPIPNSIGLLQYGEKKRIEVDKQHAQKTIHTRVVRQSDMPDVLARLKEVIESGSQVAVIYPRVEADEGERKSVSAAHAWFERMYPGAVVSIHGKLTQDEKSEVMRQAKAGEKKIIISSSIVEIGVTIKDLKMMIVVEADRFGVSTLHQFRGRLVRNGGVGYFYAYIPLPDEDPTAPDNSGRFVKEETLRRVELLEKTSNGFELAELDVAMRGFGDFLGVNDKGSGKSMTIFRGLTLMPSDF